MDKFFEVVDVDVETIRKPVFGCPPKSLCDEGVTEGDDTCVVSYIYKHPDVKGKKKIKLFEGKELRETNAQPFRSRAWKRLPTVMILEAASEHLLEKYHQSNTKVWSISINLNGHHAGKLKNEDGINYLRDEMLRQLKRFLPNPEYWLTVDINDSGRLHLHGVLACSIQQSEQIAEVLRERFCRGVFHLGFIKAVDFRPHYSPLDWAVYCCRRASRVFRVLGHSNIWVMSRPLLKEAKAYHKRQRLCLRKRRAA